MDVDLQEKSKCRIAVAQAKMDLQYEETWHFSEI